LIYISVQLTCYYNICSLLNAIELTRVLVFLLFCRSFAWKSYIDRYDWFREDERRRRHLGASRPTLYASLLLHMLAQLPQRRLPFTRWWVSFYHRPVYDLPTVFVLLNVTVQFTVFVIW